MARYVIVGSGPAGIAAAEAIRQREPRAELILLSDDEHGYYSRPGLAYYLTGEIPEAMLYPMGKDVLAKLGIRLVNARALRIHAEAHQVELQDGTMLSYDRLLIATGARAAPSDTPGSDLEGVVKLDCLDDARRILGLARKARAAVVVGGGITALEIVEGLRARGVKTHYLLRGDRYWSNVLDETESKIVEHRLVEEGVRIHYHAQIESILGKNGRVGGVRLKDGREIACGLVGVAIGVKPRLELAKSSGIEIDRGILVNEYMQTNAPDVYAAGDVAQVFDPLTGKSVLDSLWSPAREQGRAAGVNMSGGRLPYLKLVAFNVTRLANLTTTIIGAVGQGRDEDLIGIARGDSETWRQLPDAIAAQSNFDVNRLRLLVGETTLLGAIIMGDQTLSQALQHLVANQVDITPVREQLLDPKAPLADIVANFYVEWKRDYARTPQP
jgi:NAD(P)H-nitrite reductase large subunit